MFMFQKPQAKRLATQSTAQSAARNTLEVRKPFRRLTVTCLVLLLSLALSLTPAADSLSHTLGGNPGLLSAVTSAGKETARATSPACCADLFPAPTNGAVQTSASAHVLIEADSGVVLEQKDADKRLPMASTTKIMTALVALETLPTDTAVKIPREAVGVEGSSIYLTEDETLTLEELLYALLLESANDAAVAIAVTVGGSVEGFADMMNRRAEALGLTDTHFTNPHGLDDPDHYTTARELGLIAREALRLSAFREIVSTHKKTIPLHGNEGVRLLINHNKLLWQYEGCIGVKTGFTKKTGRCLVSAAERDGVTLIAVTLDAPDDWQDHTALLSHGFSLCESVSLAAPGEFSLPLWVETGDKEYVMLSNPEGLTVTLPRSRGELICTVELPRFAFAPILSGQVPGQIVFSIRKDGKRVVLGAVPLEAQYNVNGIVYQRSFRERMTDWFYRR